VRHPPKILPDMGKKGEGGPNSFLSTDVSSTEESSSSYTRKNRKPQRPKGGSNFRGHPGREANLASIRPSERIGKGGSGMMRGHQGKGVRKRFSKKKEILVLTKGGKERAVPSALVGNASSQRNTRT